MMRFFIIKATKSVFGQRFYSTNKYKHVTHCIFDMDGLLLDTEQVYKKMITQLCAKYGHKYTDDLMMKVLGGTEQRLSEILCKELKLPISPEGFREQLLKLGDTMLAGTPLLDGRLRQLEINGGIPAKSLHCLLKNLGLPRSAVGNFMECVSKMALTGSYSIWLSKEGSEHSTGAEQLILHLHKNKVPFALATSSSERSVQTKVAAHKKLFELFQHMVMGSTDPHVKFGKPHPDIFLVAAARFPDKPQPEKCLVFEDSPHGVTAAVSASMQSVMVPDPHLDKKLTTHATIVLPTLAQFRPEHFGLPAFQ